MHEHKWLEKVDLSRVSVASLTKLYRKRTAMEGRMPIGLCEAYIAANAIMLAYNMGVRHRKPGTVSK